MKNIVIGYPAKTLLYKKNKKHIILFIIYLIKEDKKTENKDKKI